MASSGSNTNKNPALGGATRPLRRGVVTQAPPQAVLSPGQKRKRQVKDRVKLAAIIIAVFVVLGLVFTYVIGTTEVDGLSMQPTLKTGNIMIIWKLPVTWAAITNSQYIPKRGSIVILQKTPVSGEELIKRVIGLPGDSVSIGSGKVTVFNSLHPNGFDPDSAPYGKGLVPIIGNSSTQVPAGQIFVLGDNRTLGASIDSRSSIGSVQSSDIMGQAIIRVYPFDHIKFF